MEILRRFKIERAFAAIDVWVGEQEMGDDELRGILREAMQRVQDGQPVWLSVVDEYYRRALEARDEDVSKFWLAEAHSFMAGMNQVVM